MALQVQADEIPASMVLYDGDVHVILAPGVERVAVGNVEIISATMLKNEEVVITAETPGETTVQLWFADDQRQEVSVVVAKANGYARSASCALCCRIYRGCASAPWVVRWCWRVA